MLNWLRRCEQFFRGQQTAPANRVWLASYDLTGVAQTWYYALEIDEGVPTRDRFADLCHQQFDPAVRTNRLSELARLPFTSSVQEYQERFNELVCHTDNLLPHQKVDLFIGGLPDHIRVDVELCHPDDLQTAMYLARAYERRAAASQLPSAPRLSRAPTHFPLPPPPRAPPLALPAPSTGAPTAAAPPPAQVQAPPRLFRRLTPAEMGERRRMGLCYNCDEQFVRGHQCKRLFNLITDDPENSAAEAEAEAALHAALMAEQPTQEGQATPNEETPRVSLYAIAGIRTRDTIVIPVFVNGQRLEALVDTGSSHTFIDTAVARRIKLESEPANLRVTVANGDKVPCAAVARGILMLVGREEFPITCFSIGLGNFDLVLGADYLRTLGTILLDLDSLRMAFQWRR
jgi:predicted aspartyl protease